MVDLGRALEPLDDVAGAHGVVEHEVAGDQPRAQPLEAREPPEPERAADQAVVGEVLDQRVQLLTGTDGDGHRG